MTGVQTCALPISKDKADKDKDQTQKDNRADAAEAAERRAHLELEEVRAQITDMTARLSKRAASKSKALALLHRTREQRESQLEQTRTTRAQADMEAGRQAK